MKNYIRIIFSSLLLIWATPSNAEFNYGVGLIIGQADSDGTETEGTAADTSDRSKSLKETFYGADLFAEYDFGGYTLGVTYVPVDKEIGSGSRTDSVSDSNDDAGTRTASAELTDMYSIYANVPISGNIYGLLAYNEVTVATDENLNASSYGNKDIDGYSVGIGFKDGAAKYEISYTDFDNFTISSSGGNTNSVAADIDTVVLRMSIGF